MNRSVSRGIVLIALALAAIVALILLPKSQPKSEAAHPPNTDPWVLVNYNPNTQYGTYLGNGYISTSVKGDGVGSACYMAGLYNDEHIIPAPTWSDVRFTDGKTEFKIAGDMLYKQSLDMRQGIITTSATWRAGNKTLTGSIEVIVSRANPNVGLVKATFTPDFDGKVWAHPGRDIMSVGALQASAGDTIDDYPSTGLRTGAVAYQLSPGEDALYLFTTVVPSAAETPGLDVTRGKQFDICSWAFLTKDSSVNSSKVPAFEKAVNAPIKFIADHKAAMAKLWEHDIIIDGPSADQQAIHSCMFYLMQSVREGSQSSIPPMGLSSEGYQGHIFWDADTWMFPALILQHPEMAKSIVDYRYNTLPGAMANAKADGFDGAQYAWESGVTGREVTPPDLAYRHERHINGDVTLAQWQYYLATGDLNWLKTRGYPVIKATADWWVSKAKFVADKGRYEILQVVPPDENAELVNNSAYTNAIAKMNLQIALQAAKLTGNRVSSKWADVADRMYIPFDTADQRFIARDNYDPRSTAKQADTELLAYPLQYEIAGIDMNPVYKNTLAYYAPKVHKNGPAMISSAHSVIAARSGDSDRAYADFLKSYQPYFREPFNLFNEKASRTIDNTCFLTGAAGPIQAAVFGLAGARMDYFPKDPAKAELTFHPCLPRQWKSLTITGVHWKGKTFDVIVTQGNRVTVLPRASKG